MYRYRLNDAKAVSETIDGEAIVIHLENGSYYSMNASGSRLWDLVLAGHSRDQLVDAAERWFEADRPSLDVALDTFLATLRNEDLIVEEPVGEDEAAAADAPPASAGTRLAFVVPAIQKYDDMQEMLIADPIHDVDEIGWPVLKQPG